MEEQVTSKSHKILFFNTLAFTICFAAWMLNGVLVTFLAENQVFDWGPIEIGWLMGIPVLTGALFRLPAGILTDKFGGKPVYGILLLLCAIPMFLLSYADSFKSFALASFGFGLTGVSFAIGIAFTSVWYPKHWQGTALGIFGAGNAGAALTTLLAPTLLKNLTDNGENIDGWRTLPIIYAAALLVMGIVFLLFTENKKPASGNKTWVKMLSPLKNIRVWRFGFYYFLVFGCFVAFSQWLVPYFVNVYYMPIVTAGIFAALFSFPSGVIRALGGWMSDKLGARKVMYWILGSSVLISFMLTVPKMDIYSPGKGIMAQRPGTVTRVSETEIDVQGKKYPLQVKPTTFEHLDDQVLVFPTKEVWQESVVDVGQKVQKKELLAKGVTRIYFQANVWIFAVLVILLGSIWGVGKAAVYKHIPDYFPEEVGVVGGMVGVLGGLGGFFSPIIFGYLLEGTGLWTSCWMFMFALSLVCLLWMHRVILKMSKLPIGFESKFVGLHRAGDREFLMPLIAWDDELSIGIENIDHQHQHLISLINSMDEVIQRGGTYEQFAPILNGLIDYTHEHFTFEEDLLEKNHCPDFEQHRQAHAQLVKEVLDWRNKAERGNVEIINELMASLRIWVTGHVLDVDKRDAPYLK